MGHRFDVLGNKCIALKYYAHSASFLVSRTGADRLLEQISATVMVFLASGFHLYELTRRFCFLVYKTEFTLLVYILTLGIIRL